MFPTTTNNHLSASRLASNHLKTWEKTLGLRICLQKPLDLANKLPLCSDKYPTNVVEQSDDFHKNLKNSLYCIQEILSSEVERCCTYENESKRVKTHHSNEVSWGNISDSQDKLQTRWETIMNKWHARLNFGSEKNKAKLKVFNHSLWEQIEQLLTDDVRTIEKSRLPEQESKRLDKVSCISSSVEENLLSHTTITTTTEWHDKELYDDRMFYAMLLKTFIMSSAKVTDTEHKDGLLTNTMRSSDLAALRLYRKKKSNVERKASKGRKVRYHVHEKLQNFMFPITSNEEFSCEIDIEKLFLSLFQ